LSSAKFSPKKYTELDLTSEFEFVFLNIDFRSFLRGIPPWPPPWHRMPGGTTRARPTSPTRRRAGHPPRLCLFNCLLVPSASPIEWPAPLPLHLLCHRSSGRRPPPPLVRSTRWPGGGTPAARLVPRFLRRPLPPHGRPGRCLCRPQKPGCSAISRRSIIAQLCNLLAAGTC